MTDIWALRREELSMLEKEVIGKTLDEAEKLCVLCRIRVLKENGKNLNGTMDMAVNRLNVGVKNGIIDEIIGRS